MRPRRGGEDEGKTKGPGTNERLLPPLEGPATVDMISDSLRRLRDHVLVEQGEDARNVQADVFQVEESDAVLLLRDRTGLVVRRQR